jgi:hypothetical protein
MGGQDNQRAVSQIEVTVPSAETRAITDENRLLEEGHNSPVPVISKKADSEEKLNLSEAWCNRRMVNNYLQSLATQSPPGARLPPVPARPLS